jgi:hypothetical protein
MTSITNSITSISTSNAFQSTGVYAVRCPEEVAKGVALRHNPYNLSHPWTLVPAWSRTSSPTAATKARRFSRSTGASHHYCRDLSSDTASATTHEPAVRYVPSPAASSRSSNNDRADRCSATLVISSPPPTPVVRPSSVLASPRTEAETQAQWQQWLSEQSGATRNVAAPTAAAAAKLPPLCPSPQGPAPPLLSVKTPRWLS